MGTGTEVAADKRVRLLEAAEAVFVERGIARATVDEITGRAGVAKGTFYLYFTSKDEVVQALQRRLWQGHVDLCEQAAARLAGEGADWWEVVDDLVAAIIDYDYAHLDWHQLVAGASAEVYDPGDDLETQIIAVTRAAIEIGIERGACHATDPEMTGTLLYQALKATAQQFCRQQAMPDRDRYVAAAQELVHKSLAR
jgi:AcrR family transcriptional regulator